MKKSSGSKKKGGERAALCASLMPQLDGVVTISSLHCIWGGVRGLILHGQFELSYIFEKTHRRI
ncbi:MAG: hypothetical protein LKJ17_04490 [Oscillospiraceae bacterium]|jgi:hypothetical protein|nr:hypothetical protein [Oscillospiraceae bacterium]